MPLREDFIHYHTRQALTLAGWHLLAGEYPNGSDDELPSLRIMDPRVARDRSPDHRRHSFNKLVPDLVAIREFMVLVVEMKPCFDSNDEAKLLHIRDNRRTDFDRALALILASSGIRAESSSLRFVPCLSMTAGCLPPRRADFAYIFIYPSGSALIELGTAQTMGEATS